MKTEQDVITKAVELHKRVELFMYATQLYGVRKKTNSDVYDEQLVAELYQRLEAVNKEFIDIMKRYNPNLQC